MKIFHFTLLAAVFGSLISCGDKKEDNAHVALPESITELLEAEIPILSLEKGDNWKYSVKVVVSEEVIDEGDAAEFELSKTREYLGKIKVSDQYPEVEVFEVNITDAPVEWELVEIQPDRILMRGVMYPKEEDTRLTWPEEPVMFRFSGMRPGLDLAKFDVLGGARERRIQVVAREQVTVPAGEFSTIRILMTGRDGASDFKNTTWFTPKIGIIKEEKTRYAGGKVLFRETTELLESNVITP